MYARSTTLLGAAEKVGDAVAHVRDRVMPAVQDLDGFVGISMMVDRASGRCIVTSAWQSLETMRASGDRVAPLREQAATLVGGATHVEEWEVALVHRDRVAPPGACVRATWMQVDPAEVERALDVYRLASLPGMRQLPGFCSASLLVDRAIGRAVSSVTYDGRDSLEASREQGRRLREEGSSGAGAEVLEVAEFELVLAHLHLPETV